MEDYQKRVVAEKKELDEKRSKLNHFLGCNKSSHIEPKARHLLELQIDAMDSYSSILRQRLDLMGISEST